MTDALSSDESAALAEFRKSRRGAGPVVMPSLPGDEQAALADFRRSKQESQFLANNASFAEAADNPQEVGAGTRAVASLPITEQGKIDYLAQKFGPENVKAGNGKIIVRDNGKWTNLNRDGLSWGDVAAMAGPAIEAVPAVAAGIATSGAGPGVAIPVAGAAGAAGNLLRQGVAKAVTGETIPSPSRSSEPELDLLRGGRMSERVSQPIISGALGALGEGVVRAGASALRAMTPTAKLERMVAKSDPQTIKEGLTLREQTGSPMSLGDITQSDEILRTEALQRQTPGAAEVVKKLDDAKTIGLNNYARKIADEAAKGTAPRASEMGTALAEVRGQIRKTYMDKLRAQALADYAKVDELSPGSSYLPTTNVQANIDKMIKSKTTRMNTAAGKSTIATLENTKKELLSEFGGALSPSEFQRSMEVWRKVAGTGQGVDLGLPRDETKEIGKTIMDGLYRDLDAAAEEVAPTTAPGVTGHHGTSANFETFDMKRSRDLGMHFGTEEQASKFGKNVKKFSLDLKKPLELERDIFSRNEADALQRAVGIIDNSLSSDGVPYAQFRDEIAKLKSLADKHLIQFDQVSREADNSKTPAAKAFWNQTRSLLKKLGYDGASYPNEVEGAGMSFVVLDPKRISLFTTSAGANTQNPAAQALKTARDNYHAGKDAIDANDSDILRRAAIMVDKSQNAGKVVADIAAGRADSVQLGKTLAVLDTNKPEVAAELRGSILRTIYAPKKGAADSPMVMLSKLDTEKNKAVTDALFAGDPQTQAKLSALKSLAKRYVNNQKMLAGSPTAPRQVATDALNSLPWIGPALRLVGHPIKTLSTLSDRMTSSAAMAQLTSTKEGVDVLLGLMKPRTSVTREAAKDIARLTARALELTANIEDQNP